MKERLFQRQDGKAERRANRVIALQPEHAGQKLGQALPYFFDEVLVLRAEKDADGNLARFFQTAGDYNFTAKDRLARLTQAERRTCPPFAPRSLAPPSSKPPTHPTGAIPWHSHPFNATIKFSLKPRLT